MKISIVIPCYNEAETIGAIVNKVTEVALEHEKEIIIVDDCSTDETREILERLSRRHQYLKVLCHPKNRGKGASLRTGFKAASGEVIIIQDADLEYDPDDYNKLLKPIVDGKADVVFGSRFIGGESHRVLYFWHSVGNKVLTLFSNIFTNMNLTDMEVCYKVFRREIVDRIVLVEDRFGFEPEFTAKLSRLKPRIFEVGISYYGRTYEEGKKVGWKDGLRAFYVIIKYGIFKK